jgi:hypothetical protein
MEFVIFVANSKKKIIDLKNLSNECRDISIVQALQNVRNQANLTSPPSWIFYPSNYNEINIRTGRSYRRVF